MATAKATAKMPLMIYGTAWKKDRTQNLVKQAILSGFRGVDTAAQPKHYQEDLVGEGIREAMNYGGIGRDQIYVQTKFTSIHGQDPKKMPYDPEKSISIQVDTSVASSLNNLRHTTEATSSVPDSQPYLDCLVLHSPFPSRKDTEEAWRAMEVHVPKHVRTLGISNIYRLDALKALYDFATVKPVVVQNRFYADTAYDGAIRAFCAENGITYQSFWTLSANPALLKSDVVVSYARSAGMSAPVALYSLVLGLGNTAVLNGTTNAEHMKEDLLGVQRAREWGEAHPEQAQGAINDFRKLVDAR